MKVLSFPGALRKDSFNRLLAKAAADIALKAGHQMHFAEFREFELPVYDGDLEESQETLPEGATKLIDAIRGHDALIISTPEYNGGIAGPFKNAIDWVSRADGPMPWAGKPILLLGASPGGLGAVRGLWHTRVPLEAIGAHVYPEMFGLPKAHEAFKDGAFIDPKNQARLEKLVHAFLKTSQSLTGAAK